MQIDGVPYRKEKKVAALYAAVTFKTLKTGYPITQLLRHQK